MTRVAHQREPRAVPVVQTPTPRPARSQALREAIAMQEIEGNPLTPDEIAMFEMFEREGWSAERRRAYILALPD